MAKQVMAAVVEPCATVVNEHGYRTPANFHLLACGHIVAIDDADQRCGRNCQHATTTISRLADHNDVQKPPLNKPRLLAETSSQHIDKLYCEVCNGIPVDRFQKMHPAPEGLSSTMRRVLAVTRVMLHSRPGCSIEQVDDMFCFPYFSSSVEDCDGQHAHKLRCGHLVWVPSARPCASNCVDWESVQRASPVTWERQGDAILCQECEGRAGLVYQRYAQEGLGLRHLTMRDI